MSPAAAFYYLRHFEFVLARVEERYGDLLDSSELGFIRNFGRVPQASRALLVRMIMRKGDLFRTDQLRYQDIDNLPAVIRSLAELQWIDAQPALCFSDVFSLLRRSELLACLQVSGNAMRSKKSEILDTYVQRYAGERKILHEWFEEFPHAVIRVTVKPLCERFRLIFFGNFRQDFSEFVLTELGARHYEKVDVTGGARPFSSAEQIEHFYQLYACRQLLEAGHEPMRVLDALPASIGAGTWLEARRARVLLRIARALEKISSSRALAAYAAMEHPLAAVRKIRLLEKCNSPGEALSACEAALKLSMPDLPRVHLARAHRRLRRRLGLPSMNIDEPRLEKIPAINFTLDKPAASSVERAARDWLELEDAGDCQVFYVENLLINALFGLLCWRALFAPVAGAFFHEFHREPADLAEPAFYARREKLFASCFDQLADGTYRETIRRNYVEKMGLVTSFVAWPSISAALIELAIACIPAPHIAFWCRLLANDPYSNRTGFPDLIQFWPSRPGYRLVEVKGPGDRLQDNQRRCLTLCKAHGVPVVVANVTWATPQGAATRAPVESILRPRQRRN